MEFFQLNYDWAKHSWPYGLAFFLLWFIIQAARSAFFGWFNKQVARKVGPMMRPLQTAIKWIAENRALSLAVLSATYCIIVVVGAQLSSGGSIPTAKFEPRLSLPQDNTISEPHTTALSGDVKFNYSDHDGRYALGTGDLLFESKWSRASNTSIYCYNDYLRGVALAPLGTTLSSLNNVSKLNFSSRVRLCQLGQFVVLQNSAGLFALLRIESIGDTTRGDHADELRFHYWIRPDGGADFSKEKG